MGHNYPNEKTYQDLLADTDNTWDLEESLEELLFDCDSMLEEAISRSFLTPIRKGDIIMANNGVSDREAGLPIESPHRVFIIEDATGEFGNRVFRGYLMSSQIRKANYYNKHFPNNVYINNYGSIINRGAPKDAEVFINLSDLYTVRETDMDRESTSLWKGHATQEFIDFIDKARKDLSTGKSIENTYWIKE